MTGELTRRQQAALIAVAGGGDYSHVSSYLLGRLAERGFVAWQLGRGWSITEAGYRAARSTGHREVYNGYEQGRLHFWLLRYGDVLTGAAS
jgi:hypothetical protein